MNAMEVLEKTFALFAKAGLEAAILASVIAIIQLLFKHRLTPAWRFALWTPVLLRLLLPVLPQSNLSLYNIPAIFVKDSRPAETFRPERNAAALAAALPAADTSVILSERTPSAVRAGESRTSWMQLAALIWASVTACLLLHLGASAVWLNRRIKRESTPVPDSLVEMIRQCGVQLGVRKTPRMRSTKAVDSPALMNFARPTLLLPPAFLNFPEEEQRHIFLHEIAHVKRCDLLTNLLMLLAAAVHWYNPVAWIVFRRMRFERELACDELALLASSGPDARSYGGTILKLARNLQGQPRLISMLGMADERHDLKQRLEHVARFTRRDGRRRIFWFAPGIVLAALVCIGLSAADTATTPPSPETQTASPALAQTNGIEKKSGAGRQEAIKALESTYEELRALVEHRRREVEEMRLKLGIADLPTEAVQADEASVRNEIKLRIFKAKQEAREAGDLGRKMRSMTSSKLRRVAPSLIEDSQLEGLLTEYNKLEIELAGLKENFDGEHPNVLQAKKILQTLDKQIESRLNGIIEGLELKEDAAERTVKYLTDSLEGSNRRLSEYQPYFHAKRELENQQRMMDTVFMRLLAEKVDAKLGIPVPGVGAEPAQPNRLGH